MIMQTAEWIYYSNEHTLGFTPQVGDEWAVAGFSTLLSNPELRWHRFGYGELDDTLSVDGYFYRRPNRNATPPPTTEGIHFI